MQGNILDNHLAVTAQIIKIICLNPLRDTHRGVLGEYSRWPLSTKKADNYES